jgi:hypothetical protein
LGGTAPNEPKKKQARGDNNDSIQDSNNWGVLSGLGAIFEWFIQLLQ